MTTNHDRKTYSAGMPVAGGAVEITQTINDERRFRYSAEIYCEHGPDGEPVTYTFTPDYETSYSGGADQIIEELRGAFPVLAGPPTDPDTAVFAGTIADELFNVIVDRINNKRAEDRTMTQWHRTYDAANNRAGTNRN